MDSLSYSVVIIIFAGYESLQQIGDDFVDCNTTYAPSDKICRETLQDFGGICNSYNKYGFRRATPCILLTLNLVRFTFTLHCEI